MNIVRKSFRSRSPRCAPVSSLRRAAETACGCKPTNIITPSATSPANSTIRGPATVMNMGVGRSLTFLKRVSVPLNRHSPDRTTFPGYSSRRDGANYDLAFQGRQMRPDSLKFLLSWTNHRPAKRKNSKPLVYDQVSSLGSPFALYDPVTVINPDAPKVD